MKEQRIEAYRVYMSDALVLISTQLSGGQAEIPRYKDLITDQAQQPDETVEQVYARFDKLRRPKA